MQDDVGTSGLEGNSRLVLGKYVPFARLSQGGMAEVFVAISRGPVGFNKLAVIKRLRNTSDGASLEMFLDEARLTARLSHPNIVNTYDVGEADGQYFLAMEYLEGQPLQTVLARNASRDKPFDARAASFIAIQALKGLHYAHELADYDGAPLSVVHRDVSPQNLFLTYQGEIKLLDFGIAKATVNFTQTETGVFKGKVRYMAPEQIGEKHIDRRADIFALGVVLWEMLAGRALYSGRADVASIVTRITGSEPPLIRTLRPDVSVELEAIVARALRRDRDARYATADEMRLDLERALRGQQEAASTLLAQMLNDTFAETRDAVRARVRTFLADLPSVTGSGNMPTLAPASDPLGGEDWPRSVRTGPELDLRDSKVPSDFSASGLSATARSVSGLTGQSRASSLPSPHLLSSRPSTPPPARKTWAWAMAAVAGIVAIGVAAVRETRAPASAAEMPAPPVAAVAAVGALSAGAVATVTAPAPGHVEPPPSPPPPVPERSGQALARTPSDPNASAAAPRGRHPSRWWSPSPKRQASPPPPATSTAEARARIRVIDDGSTVSAAAAANPTTGSSAGNRKIRIVDTGTP